MVPKLPRSETYVWALMPWDLNQAISVWNIMQPQMVCLQYAETRKWAALNSTSDTDPKDAARAHYLPFQRLSVYYNICTSKIKQIYDNKIAEFKYKFLMEQNCLS